MLKNPFRLVSVNSVTVFQRDEAVYQIAAGIK